MNCDSASRARVGLSESAKSKTFRSESSSSFLPAPALRAVKSPSRPRLSCHSPASRLCNLNSLRHSLLHLLHHMHGTVNRKVPVLFRAKRRRNSPKPPRLRKMQFTVSLLLDIFFRTGFLTKKQMTSILKSEAFFIISAQRKASSRQEKSTARHDNQHRTERRCRGRKEEGVALGLLLAR